MVVMVVLVLVARLEPVWWSGKVRCCIVPHNIGRFESGLCSVVKDSAGQVLAIV